MIRHSTESQRGRDKVAFWADLVCQHFVPAEYHSVAAPESSHGAMALRRMRRAKVVQIVAGALSATRTARLICAPAKNIFWSASKTDGWPISIHATFQSTTALSLKSRAPGSLPMRVLSIVRSWWQSAIEFNLPADGKGTVNRASARGKLIQGTTPTVRNWRLLAVRGKATRGLALP